MGTHRTWPPRAGHSLLCCFQVGFADPLVDLRSSFAFGSGRMQAESTIAAQLRFLGLAAA